MYLTSKVIAKVQAQRNLFIRRNQTTLLTQPREKVVKILKQTELPSDILEVNTAESASSKDYLGMSMGGATRPAM